MKKVFQSNSELAHVWANQLQSEGVANNMFFHGPVIYSYGTHYEIARFVEAPNGEKVCFVNSRTYSNSTAKHTGHVWNAIPDGIKAYMVPFDTYIRDQFIDEKSLPVVIEKMLIECKNFIDSQLRSRTYFGQFFQAYSRYNNIVEICQLFNLDIPARPENWEKARQKSELLRASQGERERAKELKKVEKEKELLEKWLSNEYNGQLYGIPVHLRFSKDGQFIETTKGAKVEKEKALVLLEKLQKFDAVGEKINGFTVIENTLDHVKIGCHTINWGIINKVFSYGI